MTLHTLWLTVRDPLAVLGLCLSSFTLVAALGAAWRALSTFAAPSPVTRAHLHRLINRDVTRRAVEIDWS